MRPKPPDLSLMREQIIERGENPEDYPILKSRPIVWDDLHWIWESFMFLSGSRQMGFNGPQPISIPEVLAYSEFRGIHDMDEREELLHHIQRLDQVFLSDYYQKKAKSPPKK